MRYEFGDIAKSIYYFAEKNGWIDRAKEELSKPENQEKIAKAIEKAIKKIMEKDD